MSKRQPQVNTRKDSVRNWPFQLPPLDRNFTLSPLEVTTLATWKAQGHIVKYSTKIKPKTKQQLHRLIQPIKAALLHYVSKGAKHLQNACVLLLLHEMHRRQTSLWAWDAIAWTEIAGNTNEEFKRIHHDFEHAYHISSVCYRQLVLACAYLLGEISIYQLVTDYHVLKSAQNIFGGVAVEKAVHALTTESTRLGQGTLGMVNVATCSALLANRSPELERLTLPVLEKISQTHSYRGILKNTCIKISKLLYNLEIMPDCMSTPHKHMGGVRIGKEDVLSADWVNIIKAWDDTSTTSEEWHRHMRASIAKAARWATEKYPDAASPQQWTRSTAIAYVKAVPMMKRGQWAHPKSKPTPDRDKPLTAAYQADLLACLRLFFSDCHEWEWFPIAFKPNRCLATPKLILAKLGPKPRSIDPAQWAKLQEAGLSLTENDLPLLNIRGNVTRVYWYPLAMVRAIALVWLYTGLRANEIRRLRVGCIRPIPGEEHESMSSSTPTICWLTVPEGKNGDGYRKPVIRPAGDAVELWEKDRPFVPKMWDDKSAEAVDFLFVWKGERIGYTYLNDTIIPMLCRKAGIPVEDASGKITSHRARHTLATQLANAPTPLRGPYLSNWMGHRSRDSSGYYVQENERKLLETYAAANHVSIDKRQLEQLKEPTTIGGEPATENGSVPSVDLGHGFCTYDFHVQCKQRTPCTNCSFYKPKASRYSQVEESKSQLLHLMHHLPLPKEVRQAVEDGITAHETLLVYLRTKEENPPS